MSLTWYFVLQHYGNSVADKAILAPHVIMSYLLEPLGCSEPGAHNERRKGEGEEREAPTHLIEISEHTHAERVTKNRQNRKVCSQEK